MAIMAIPPVVDTPMHAIFVLSSVPLFLGALLSD
jgi:hypothetical protein